MVLPLLLFSEVVLRKLTPPPHQKGLLDERGRSVLDGKPMALPVGITRPTPLNETIARLVTQHLSRVAAENGFETAEEADDFDVDDDPEIKTSYEIDAEVAQAVSFQRVRREVQELNEKARSDESAAKEKASAEKAAAAAARPRVRSEEDREIDKEGGFDS